MNKNKFFGIVGLVAVSALGVIAPFVASAQTIPTVGTSDIASVGGAVLSPLITGGEYLMTAFGPPLLYFGLVVLVFWAIRSYVSKKRPRV